MKLKIRTANPVAFFVVWVVAAIFNLCLVGGLIWVAWHFVSKWW